VPLADLKQRIQGVVDRKGGIEILQLSGGEPTLHPQFFELIEWIQDNPGIDYLLLNTNGVRIALDEKFIGGLARAVRRANVQLYLQFDGVQSEGQLFLRGADLRATRLRAIERCREINLPITLAMTVTPQNLPFLWAAIEFGLHYQHIRGISFQPTFQSGRTPDSGSGVWGPGSGVWGAVAQKAMKIAPRPSPVPHPQTPDLIPQTPDPRPQSRVPRPQTSDPRPQTPDPRPQTPNAFKHRRHHPRGGGPVGRPIAL